MTGIRRVLFLAFVALLCAYGAAGLGAVAFGDDVDSEWGGAAAAFSAFALLVLFGLRRGGGAGGRPVPPAFREQVLQVLAAAARRGESAGGALAAVAEEVGGRRRQAVLAVLERLDGGASLTESLAGPGGRFLSPEEAAAVRAVEGTGRLADVLASSPGRSRDWADVRNRVAISIGYALLMLCIGWFLTVFIVPQFFMIGSEIEYEAGLDASGLPSEGGGPVRDMLARGLAELRFVLRAFPLLIKAGIGLSLLLVVLEVFRRNPGLAVHMRSALVRLPGVGRVVRLEAGGRVLRVMGILVSSGVPLHEVLSRAAPVSGVGTMEAGMEEAAISVAHGGPLARALEGAGLPAFATARLLAASAGPPDSFGRALGVLSAECEERAMAAASVASAFCYPLVLVFVGGIAFLTYRGIFMVTGGIQEVCRPW
ncbi:MAG: type II secretion system F family protein [Planctomycetes bacterium]|nr:type II secretion system F family protein [Planctomycetota bacterium]